MKKIIPVFKEINCAISGLKLFILCLVGVSLCSGQSLSADTAGQNTVDSIMSLQQQVSKAKPGDIIKLKDGTYSEKITLTGKGTAKEPIQIRAESLGGVEISNKVTIKGEYLSLVGFRFTGKGRIDVNSSTGCRVSRCHFNNVQEGNWIRVNHVSRQIELDHCLFEKKEINRKLNRSCQTVQFILVNKDESHYIHHNHFRDIPKGKTGNGFETVQLITKGNPKDPKGKNTGNRVEYNLFERCNGEGEIISVKSNGNLLRGNAFIDCKGALVLRQGHRNVVNGNWFIGGSHGVRIQGRDQVVVNNYFEGLFSGLVMMNGIERDGKPFYVRVEHALIANNTFINCEKTFRIGMNHSQCPPGIIPGKSTIANNIFYQENSKEDMITLQDGKEPEDWTWQNNLFQGTLGIPPRDGIKVGSAYLNTNKGGVALPTDKTPTAEIVETKMYSVKNDLLGVKRKDQTTLGAIQYPVKVPIERITEKLVGPHFEQEGKDSK